MHLKVKGNSMMTQEERAKLHMAEGNVMALTNRVADLENQLEAVNARLVVLECKPENA